MAYVNKSDRFQTNFLNLFIYFSFANRINWPIYPVKLFGFTPNLHCQFIPVNRLIYLDLLRFSLFKLDVNRYIESKFGNLCNWKVNRE